MQRFYSKKHQPNKQMVVDSQMAPQMVLRMVLQILLRRLLHWRTAALKMVSLMALQSQMAMAQHTMMSLIMRDDCKRFFNCREQIWKLQCPFSSSPPERPELEHDILTSCTLGSSFLPSLKARLLLICLPSRSTWIPHPNIATLWRISVSPSDNDAHNTHIDSQRQQIRWLAWKHSYRQVKLAK